MVSCWQAERCDLVHRCLRRRTLGKGGCFYKAGVCRCTSVSPSCHLSLSPGLSRPSCFLHHSCFLQSESKLPWTLEACPRALCEQSLGSLSCHLSLELLRPSAKTASSLARCLYVSVFLFLDVGKAEPPMTQNFGRWKLFRIAAAFSSRVQRLGLHIPRKEAVMRNHLRKSICAKQWTEILSSPPTRSSDNQQKSKRSSPISP